MISFLQPLQSICTFISAEVSSYGAVSLLSDSVAADSLSQIPQPITTSTGNNLARFKPCWWRGVVAG